ncbi:MAG TPA: methyltransferase domain-containing protein [Burkholderiaceae bacterium]|nr:methyltransferase domain-containing protein [Burkholderiaceae bacterium]
MPLAPGEADIAPTLVAKARVPMRWQTVQRQFDRRAARLGPHDFLLREVSNRLIDRLDYIRLTPARIVDVGCGAGGSREPLSKRFPGAHWTGVDLSLPMMLAANARRGPLAAWFDRARGRARSSEPICAEATQLPFADATFELVFSNLMLHWHPRPHDVFPEWKRVLTVDGLLLFSCFGPDTLQELRAACAETLRESYPMPFIDMHDFGDMMVAAGFATPVMDVETIRLTYGSAHELLAEARALGGNPRDDRAHGLVAGTRARALLAALERRRDATGRIPLTFEVAYGHAWKPAPRGATEAVISLDRLRAGLAGRRR